MALTVGRGVSSVGYGCSLKPGVPVSHRGLGWSSEPASDKPRLLSAWETPRRGTAKDPGPVLRRRARGGARPCGAASRGARSCPCETRGSRAVLPSWRRHAPASLENIFWQTFSTLFGHLKVTPLDRVSGAPGRPGVKRVPRTPLQPLAHPRGVLGSSHEPCSCCGCLERRTVSGLRET